MKEMECDACGHKLMPGQAVITDEDRTRWRCPACESLTEFKGEPSSVLSGLLISHLDKARNELILAYNAAKQEGLEDSRTAIAWTLADVSAELQCQLLMKQSI